MKNNKKNNNVCRFLKKETSNESRDHCLLTGEYGCPAQQKFNKNVTQRRSSFIPFDFHEFSKFDCQFFSKVTRKEKR